MKEALKVLVAEDEYLVMMGIKSSLEKLGHQIIAEATDGKMAVELALQEHPDLIVMDINMPNLDGIEAINAINEQLVVPSIIVSGYSDNDLLKRATEAGVFAYLVKPVDVKELQPAINIAMTRFKEFIELNRELQDTKNALKARKYIERAKGILMDTLNINEDEAMKRLQKKSRDNNKKLLVIAKEIIKAHQILSK